MPGIQCIIHTNASNLVQLCARLYDSDDDCLVGALAPLLAWISCAEVCGIIVWLQAASLRLLNGLRSCKGSSHAGPTQ